MLSSVCLLVVPLVLSVPCGPSVVQKLLSSIPSLRLKFPYYFLVGTCFWNVEKCIHVGDHYILDKFMKS